MRIKIGIRIRVPVPVQRIHGGLSNKQADLGVGASVAKGPKFRPQNTKWAEKNCVGPGKFEAEFLADLSKKGRKGAELFWDLNFHKIN
jgi:hypothetical protein